MWTVCLYMYNLFHYEIILKNEVSILIHFYFAELSRWFPQSRTDDGQIWKERSHGDVLGLLHRVRFPSQIRPNGKGDTHPRHIQGQPVWKYWISARDRHQSYRLLWEILWYRLCSTQTRYRSFKFIQLDLRLLIVIFFIPFISI